MRERSTIQILGSFALLCSFFGFSILTASAQESRTKAPNPKWSIRPSTRLLLDGVGYTLPENSQSYLSGFRIGVRDMRLGVLADYDRWTFKLETALSNREVVLKDAYISYSFTPQQTLLFGNALVPFGLISSYGTLDKTYMESPLANLYDPSRRLGVTYTAFNKALWFRGGFYGDKHLLDGKVRSNIPVGFMTGGRFVWRSKASSKDILHFGLSALFVSPEWRGNTEEKERGVYYSLSFMNKVLPDKALSIGLPTAKWEVKESFEAMWIRPNFKLTTQLYLSSVKLGEKLPFYSTGGGYITAETLLFTSGSYRYSVQKARSYAPTDGALEVVAGYGFLSLESFNNPKHWVYTGSKAGKIQDLTLGATYHFNKHFTFRLNLHNLWYRVNEPTYLKEYGDKFNYAGILQARLQCRF